MMEVAAEKEAIMTVSTVALATATTVPYSCAASCLQHTYCTKVYGLISLNKTPAPYLPQVRGCIGLEMRDNGGLYCQTAKRDRWSCVATCVVNKSPPPPPFPHFPGYIGKGLGIPAQVYTARHRRALVMVGATPLHYICCIYTCRRI